MSNDLTHYLRQLRDDSGRCRRKPLLDLASAAGPNPRDIDWAFREFVAERVGKWWPAANRLGVSRLRFVRNLLACATNEDLPSYLLVVECGLEMGLFGDDTAMLRALVATSSAQRALCASAGGRSAARASRASGAAGSLKGASAQARRFRDGYGVLLRQMLVDDFEHGGGWRSALSAIADRTMPRVSETAWRMAPDMRQQPIEAAIFGANPHLRSALPAEGHERSLIAAWKPSLLRSALMFLAAPYEERLALLEGFPPGHRRQLAARLPIDDWAETLEDCPDRCLRSLAQFSAARRLKLLRALCERGGADTPTGILLQYLRATPASDPLGRKLIAELPAALTFVQGSRRLSRLALDIVEEAAATWCGRPDGEGEAQSLVVRALSDGFIDRPAWCRRGARARSSFGC